MILSAGLSRKNISPPPGIYLIGYGARTKGNLGVHDDITATALALDDGLHRAVIVSCDLLAINEHTVALVQAQTGSNIVVCCSHTHSGPITYAGQHSSRKNREYINYLVTQIVDAVKAAIADLKPVRLAWAQGQADIAVNRRERMPYGRVEIGINPTGPIDRSFSLLQIQALDGQPIATLLNFQCHGTVLGPKNMLVSADWIGAMRRHVEQVSGAPLMYLQGATGDLNPDQNGAEDDFTAVEATGLRIAEQVENALPHLESLSGDAVSFHQEQVWLSLDAEVSTPNPPPVYRHVLAKMAHVPCFLVDSTLNYRYPWKTHIAPKDGYWAIPVVLTHIRVGELALYALGAEVFTEIGMEIKRISPSSHTMFASLSSGCIGYLPTESEYVLGGYEVEMAPYFYRLPGKLKGDCAGVVLEAVRKLAP